MRAAIIAVLADVVVAGGVESDLRGESLAAAAVEAASHAVDTHPEAVVSEARPAACALDPSCIAGVLDRAGAEEALVVVAHVSRTKVLITCQVVSAVRGVIAARVGETETPSRASEVARAKVLDVLGASGRTIGGRLAIEVTPADAAVAIEGAGDAPVLGTTWTLPAGQHVVVATREGFAAQRVPVLVERGRTQRSAILLTEEAGFAGWLADSPWVWVVAGGVVAAGAAVAIAAAVSAGSEPLVLCHGPSPAPCE